MLQKSSTESRDVARLIVAVGIAVACVGTAACGGGEADYAGKGANLGEGADAGAAAPDFTVTCPDSLKGEILEGNIHIPGESDGSNQMIDYRYRFDRGANTLTMIPRRDGEQLGEVKLRRVSGNRTRIEVDVEGFERLSTTMDAQIFEQSEENFRVMRQIVHEVADGERRLITRELVEARQESTSYRGRMFRADADSSVLGPGSDVPTLRLSEDGVRTRTRDEIRSWMSQHGFGFVRQLREEFRLDDPRLMDRVTGKLRRKCLTAYRSGDNRTVTQAQDNYGSQADNIKKAGCDLKDGVNNSINNATSAADDLGGTARESAFTKLTGIEIPSVPTIPDLIFDRIGDGICDDDPSNKGGGWGDPHLVTLDGLGYSFQASGEFVAIESPRGDGLEVQVRQQPIGESECPSISRTTALVAKVTDHRVGFYTDRDHLIWVDGEPASLAGGFLSLGEDHWVTRLDATTYAVQWPTGDRLRVRTIGGGERLGYELLVSDARRGQVRGLLGRFNGKPRDDLALRDGTVLEPPVDWETLYGRFADSWRISQEESLFDYKSGESTDFYTDKSVPGRPMTLNDLSNSEKREARETCEDGGVDAEDDRVMRDCIIDVHCTGDASYAGDHAGRDEPAGELAVERPTDFREWTQEGKPEAGDWEVQNQGQRVEQTSGDRNQTHPTMFVSSSEYIGETMEAELRCGQQEDGNWVGMVFGYRAPVSANGDAPSEYETFIFGWDACDRDWDNEEFALLHVEGSPTDPIRSFADMKAGPSTEVLAGNVGSPAPWWRGVEAASGRTLQLTYTEERIEIAINGHRVVDLEAADVSVPFEPGRLGFYHFPQKSEFDRHGQPRFSNVRIRPAEGTLVPDELDTDFGSLSNKLALQDGRSVEERIDEQTNAFELTSVERCCYDGEALWIRGKPEVAAGFRTSFEFRVSDLGPVPNRRDTTAVASSISLVVHNQFQHWYRRPPELGSGRVGGSANKVAVEFDMKQQDNHDFEGPNDNHISIVSWPSDEVVPLETVSSDLPDFDDQQPHTATIEYTPDTANPADSLLAVYVDGSSEPVIQTRLDLTETLGLSNNQAYIGITSDGFDAATQQINWWRYRTTGDN